MNDFKINSIQFNDASILEPNKINIIVGPNSSGKSRTLKDIKNLLSNNNNNQYSNESVVISNLDYDIPDDYKEFIDKYDIENRIVRTGSGNYIRNYFGANFTNLDSNSSISNYMENNSIYMQYNWLDELKNDFERANKNNIKNVSGYDIPKNAKNVEIVNQTLLRYQDNNNIPIEQIIGGTSGPITYENDPNKVDFIRKYGTLFFQYLGTEEKLFMCKRQRRYGIENANLNLLSESQLHIEDIKELSKITKELFGKYIYLDRNSYGDSLAFRVSEDYDFYKKIETNNSKSERNLLKYPLLDEEGDGIKNFVSTYLAIKSMNKRLILIDEPESFLHPPLARRFGEILSSLIGQDQQLFIVTHSEDIINGIIAKTPSTQFNIIRIVRNKNVNNVYIMPQKERLALKRNPILLMSNILKGLFSEKVYITESFSDSAIYQLLMIKSNNNSSFYFVNTECKDKIGEIIKIYDLMGVNNTAIYDFDYFRKENTIKSSLKEKLGATKEYQRIYDTFKKTRDYIDKLSNEILKVKDDDYENLSLRERKDKLRTIKDDLYHNKGISCIEDATIREELNEVIEELKNYRIYILKSGALETVLQEIEFDSSNNKSAWIDRALDFVENLSENKIKKTGIYDLISGKV